MVEAVLEPEASGSAPRPEKPKQSWGKRLLREFAALLLVLIGLLTVAVLILDSQPGHRWVVDRIANLEIKSGLKIEIGRIEGSLFDEARLKNVRISDPDGVFLTSPEIVLDWRPGAWLGNKLHIDALTAEKLTLTRLPKLRPSTEQKPLLPDFDIHIGRLAIERFEIGEAVTGTPRVGRVEGSADVRRGRAMVKLDGGLRGGDRFALLLDAAPKRNRLDVDADISAPADGLLPALIGIKAPVELKIAGDGDWKKWRGRARASIANRPALNLALTADDGLFGLDGTVRPLPGWKGKKLRLSSPAVAVKAKGTFEKSIFDGDVSLASQSLRVVARGAVDLVKNRYDDVRIGAELLRPPALFPNMSGRQIRLAATLDGAMGKADYSYRLTSPLMKFDDTGFVDLRAEGRGTTSKWPMRVPLRVGAKAVSGVGDVAGAILANVRIEGFLSVTPKLVRGEKLVLRSDKLSGEMGLMIDLITGEFDVALTGGMRRYLIPGLGLVDVQTDLKVVPGAGGRARVTGTAEARVQRLDNSFFRGLMGGLPRITTKLVRDEQGVIHFSNLQLYSPKLRLSGSGMRRRDGTFQIEARGRQAEYGPVRMKLDGRIERPRIELWLENPNKALDIRNMHLILNPTSAGFDYVADGGSRLGPFTSNGRILLPSGGRAIFDIAQLKVAGTTGKGALRSDPGGFTGRLTLAGGGLDGTLAFAVQQGAQAIKTDVAMRDASLPGPTPIIVRSGEIDGLILLAEGSSTINGTMTARGVKYGAISIARLDATGSVVNGSGKVDAKLAGRRGRAFDLALTANFTPDRIAITGGGQVDRRKLRLLSPAVLTAIDGGWQIAPTRVSFGGGLATLSGRTGADPVIDASLQRMPLQLLDMAIPDLGLSGIASGSLDYRWRGTGGRPSGNANLRIRGLSRSGLVLSSTPIDLGLNAKLANGSAAMRAVAVSEGKTIGRAQARFAPLGGGPIVAALMDAPMRMQVRYNGPADTLWRLSGVEVFDLSGPIAIGADMTGSLVDPTIRGSLRSTSARVESAVTGIVLQDVAMEGSFGGSRLVLRRIAGRTPANGTVNGSGTVNFSGGSPAFDLKFDIKDAQVIDRDDIEATVTGPLAIRSDGIGGTIAGNLNLIRGKFRLGNASGGAGVPRLAVRHVGRGVDDLDIEERQLAPWKLNVKLAGDNLKVEGLGLDSLWRTQLDIGGTITEPRITGIANLDRGNYEFAGRGFRLERGTIRFRGRSPSDPLLDIRAEAQVQGLDAAVLVRGSGQRPEITFASVPPLPQDELLSRILFGTSIANLAPADAIQLAAAVAALQDGTGNLDPINKLRRAVGLDRLRIVPADISTGQKTALSAGKYIGRKLYVEVITDGQGYSATRVEYQVTRWLSLLSSISTIGRTSANVRISKDY